MVCLVVTLKFDFFNNKKMVWGWFPDGRRIKVPDPPLRPEQSEKEGRPPRHLRGPRWSAHVVLKSPPTIAMGVRVDAARLQWQSVWSAIRSVRYCAGQSGILCLCIHCWSLRHSLLLVIAGPVPGLGGQGKYVPRRRTSPPAQPRTASLRTPSPDEKT